MLLSAAKDDLILGQMPNTMIVCFHFVYAGDPVQSRKCGHHSGIIFFSSWFMDPHCESVITFFSVNRSQLDAEAMLHYAHIYGDWEWQKAQVWELDESGGFRFHFASRPCHILPRSRWYRLKSSWKLLILGWSDQKIYNGSLIWVSVLFLSFPPCHLHSMRRYLSLQASKQDTAWNTRWRRKVTALTLPWRLFVLFLPINSQALSIILLFLQSLCVLSSSHCYVKCINFGVLTRW